MNRFRILFSPDGGDPAGGGAPPAVPAVPAGGGTPSPAADWKATLPDDLKSSPTIKDIKSIDDLVKGYVHAQKAIGNNVAIPGPNATPEEQAAFFNKVGRPEAPDKYDFGKVDAEAKVKPSAEVKAAYMKQAHEAGLSNRQAAMLYRWYMDSSSSALEGQAKAMQAMQQEAVGTLKSEWGDAYPQNIDLARSAVQEFGGEELTKMLEETGLGNDPRLIKAFAKIGRGLSEDKLHSEGRRSDFKHTPREAEAMIAQKMSDSEFMKAYLDGDHPGHSAAVKVLSDLYASKNSGA